MAKLKPWYQVITPREDLRENRPLDASEFAVHLDHIRDKRAHVDYLKPERFFERTFLTTSLMELSSQVVRRLSGIRVETSAVFNMATQFGGGKTHALTALYHLSRGGDAARNWKGIESVLLRADVKHVPKADVAVFVGTEFDVLEGRGEEGEPKRKTPWGEIAWQLGGEKSFAVVAAHDDQLTAPGGDVIRRMLPNGPVLILMDELLNYVSRGRKIGLGDQLFNFIQNISEEARARDNMVLCVSIPASELEMNPDDQRDYDSFKKMLDRVGRAISMSSNNEVTEIIRRRLFEWYGGIPDDGKKVVAAYAEWAGDHASEVAHLGGESPSDIFAATYPFHPSVISVFERKWQSLPRFQRTRGILRLLALWVSKAYQEEHRKASSEPLILLGSAPLDDQMFRDALFEQLGSDQLSTPVTTDIAGKKDSHSIRLDKEATESIRKGHLHQKVATVIFFESNGGQSQNKAEASLPEIRAALGGPEVNLADIETALEGLTSTCYYLSWDRNRYRFGLRPNLNQMLVTRRGSVSSKNIEERVRKSTADLFKSGAKAVDRRYFPSRSNDVPDRPQLTIVVLGTDKLASDANSKTLMETIVRESGASGRTFKSALLFSVADSNVAISDGARNLLAWEDINDDEDSVAQFEDSQRRFLSQSLQRASKDLDESIWRGYRHVFLLDKENKLKDVDLGQITSSMATSIADLIVTRLTKDDEITESVGANRLVRIWPPAIKEWSTRDARDAFFASPSLPRLLEPDSIKRTVADGVSGKLLGYARKEASGRFVLERFGESMSDAEVEIAEDVYILKAEDAQKLVEPPHLARLSIQPDRVEIRAREHVTFKVGGFDQYGQTYPVDAVEWLAPGSTIDQAGLFVGGDSYGRFTVTAKSGIFEAEALVRIFEEEQRDEIRETTSGSTPTITWSGIVPPQKWMNFYTKVVSRLSSSPELTLNVSVEASAPDEAQARTKIDEMKSALRDLGLNEDAKFSKGR